MTTSSNNQLPASLVANLQSVLVGRKGASGGGDEDKDDDETQPKASGGDGSKEQNDKPIVLLTNCDGINSPGLGFLVDALVLDGRYDVHVCAPELDKSASGHSVTLGETLAVSSLEMNGATAFEVSGTPVDCVSLALCGALFAWSRPALVVSGINKGPSCGHNILYSGAIAGAREALMRGIPSLSFSLNWRKDESKESDFKDAVDVCLPLIQSAIRDSVKGLYPKDYLLNVEVPLSPSTNKGFKVTRQSVLRPSLNWQAISASRNPAAGQYMSMHQSLGIQLAQLGRDASAAGAQRRVTTQKKNVEIESVAAAGKPETQRGVKKYFRLEFVQKEHEDSDEDLDFRAVENGYVSVTPLRLHENAESQIQASASDWITSASVDWTFSVLAEQKLSESH